MLLSATIVPILMSMAAVEEPPVTVKGFPWAPFISPMGEPFRPPTSGEAPIARWFKQADRNQDGMLVPAEMQLDAERFFARLDSNHDLTIDREEMKAYEWQVAPEIQVNSEWRQLRGQPRNRDRHDGYRTDSLQGAARYGLLNMPQPVASADADFNRTVSLDEFRQAAAKRFALLDNNGRGSVTLTELETRLPIRPKGRRAKPHKDAVDTRIGSPLPDGE